MRKTQEQKMFRLVSGWLKSGVSKKAWCVKHEIQYRIFYYWHRKYLHQQSSDVRHDSNGFVQLMVAGSSPVQPWCELVVGHYKRLLFFHQPDVDFIKALVP